MSYHFKMILFLTFTYPYLNIKVRKHIIERIYPRLFYNYLVLANKLYRSHVAFLIFYILLSSTLYAPFRACVCFSCSPSLACKWCKSNLRRNNNFIILLSHREAREFWYSWHVSCPSLFLPFSLSCSLLALAARCDEFYRTTLITDFCVT